MFRQEKSRVVDQNVYIGTEEVWGIFDRVMPSQGTLRDPSLLQSCVLALHTDADLPRSQPPLPYQEHGVFPDPWCAPL